MNGHTQDGETVSRSTHVQGRRPQALAKARAPRRTAGLEAAGAPPILPTITTPSTKTRSQRAGLGHWRTPGSDCAEHPKASR